MAVYAHRLRAQSNHHNYALQPFLPATVLKCMRGVEDMRWYLPDFP
jgi:hypothetical protein